MAGSAHRPGKAHQATVRAERARDAVAERPRAFRLRVVGHDGARRVFNAPLASVRVGAGAGNDLVVDDPAVSRIHLEIGADAHGFRLRDLGSTNGTLVDGQRAGDVHLRQGARIRIGATTLHFEALDRELEVARSEDDRFGPLVGRAACMRELFATLTRVAASEATVLVEGESGTGKELVAEALHGASARKHGAFVVFDCAAVPPSLLEAELFGHERGAFTGAEVARAGCLEQADGGTLFVDEIGELPRELQPKLLRALEKREFRRVGSAVRERADVRIVAATNRDLAREVNLGTFREDLYYRLAVVRVVVPPLRERREDLRALVECFVSRAVHSATAASDLLATVGAARWQALVEHAWPGNVRELRNAVERALALGAGRSLDALEPGLSPATPAARAAPEGTGEGWRFPVDPSASFLAQKAALVARFEEAYLRASLAHHEGKITRAAAAAGIDRTYYRRLVTKYGL
jgi:DNA-binding NtrC family response regulator